jgi:predicted dehydrogenase
VSERVLLLGAGGMGCAYAHVLRALGRTVEAVCRSANTAESYTKQTGLPALHGGLDAYLASGRSLPSEAIVAVNVEELASVTEALIRSGVRQILVEKPGALSLAELDRVARTARESPAEVVVGYNRRFYASTQRAAKMIAEDGGASSVVFDFTERSRAIAHSKTPAGVKAAWLLANSSHVIDLAFFLAGDPAELQAQALGALDWHPRGAVFSGVGKTVRGAAFSYHADWRSPGRWSVDVRTPARRLLLSPLETLRTQSWDGFDLRDEPLDDALDRTYKPGLFRQVEAFLTGEGKEFLPTLEEQVARVRQIFEPIASGRRA